VKLDQQTSLVVVLATTAAFVWIYPTLRNLRHDTTDSTGELEVSVTSGANNGPGTLRDAVFRVLRSDRAASITLRADTIALTTPLPPLSTTHGIRIRSGRATSVIDASALRGVPVLDVRAGDIDIRRVEIRNAPAEAVRTSGGNVHLEDVKIHDSAIAVAGFSGYRLSLVTSELERNGIGVQLNGAGTSLIQNTVFREHATAGVWAIQGQAAAVDVPSLEVASSHFDGGRYGMVLGNVLAKLHDNDIANFSLDGVLVVGGVLDISHNQIRHGGGVGIRALGPTGGAVVANEIQDVYAIGILVQASSSTRVEGNQLYRNGYGIATVLSEPPAAVRVHDNLLLAQTVDGLIVIGDSPLVADNRMLQNRLAGIRVLDWVSTSTKLRATPNLVGNELANNGMNEPVFAVMYAPAGGAR
jgi:hypothetical protein